MGVIPVVGKMGWGGFVSLLSWVVLLRLLAGAGQAQIALDGSLGGTAGSVDSFGGFMQMTSKVFLVDPGSRVTAKSDDVRSNGEVDIRAPVTDLSGIVPPLSSSFHQTAALGQNRCATRLQEKSQSRFVLRGRNRVPFDPGQLLPSSTRREGERITRIAQSIGTPQEVAVGSGSGPRAEAARPQGTGYLLCDNAKKR